MKTSSILGFLAIFSWFYFMWCEILSGSMLGIVLAIPVFLFSGVVIIAVVLHIFMGVLK